MENINQGLQEFTNRAQEFLDSMAPVFGYEARKGLSVEEDIELGRKYLAKKYEAGFAGINWRKEMGGLGLTHIEKLAFESLEMKYGFPFGYFSISLGMPVPIMQKYVEDKEWARTRTIAALKGEEIWCQLFSEPSGGSDLAALRTRAEKLGDDWVLNGQKVWTSWAQYCDYGVIVVRTDPTVPKHQGLSYFWVDMKAKGVEVRPIKLAGGDSHINEVFFDNVILKDNQRLGPVGGGFGVAIETLMIERYIATDPAGFGPDLDLFLSLAQNTQINNKPAIDDGRIRSQIARNYAMRNALSSITKRAFLMMQKGMLPGPEGSLNKLVSVRSRQKLSELALDLMGTDGYGFDAHAFVKQDWKTSWLNAASMRIAGGADEILLNTIAEKILGLPQDYRPDKNIPFNELS